MKNVEAPDKVREERVGQDRDAALIAKAEGSRLDFVDAAELELYKIQKERPMEAKRIAKASRKASILDVLNNLGEEEEEAEEELEEKVIEEREQDILCMF